MKNRVREILINCLYGIKREKYGAQKPGHINRIVVATNTTQRSNSPVWAINQHFPGYIIHMLFIIVPALIPILGAAPDVRAEDLHLSKGTQITLQLNDTLSTASNMEGDEFTAAVTNPVYIGDQLIIPKGSVVTGSVSRILRPDRLKGKAVLDLMFQSIRVPGYKTADIAATLTRIDPAGSSGKQNTENFAERDSTTGDTAKSANPKIGVRAQSPGGKSPNAGASGGLPSVFNSQGDDLQIPRGTSMDITLDRPLTLTEETGKPAQK